MTTTSLKLSDELKQRAADAAQEMGMSAHAFMVAAIEQAATVAELRVRLLADARAARDEVLETGTGYDADRVHAYMKAKVAGKKVAKPRARAWRG